jgi:hypothetical protein
MSVAAPPDIDVCDGIEDDDDLENRKCHLLNEDLLPYCGRIPRRGIGPIHQTIYFLDPCVSCGLPRCMECAALWEASRI